MTKRAGYREAIEWIALNDDSEIGTEKSGFIITICLTADLFGKDQTEVAAAVMRYREKHL